jgi:DNA-binding NarL/FixJ family response regulator
VSAPSATLIRVALLDDHPAVLTGLRRLLEAVHDVEIVAAAGDPVTLAQALDGQRADILIMDYDPIRSDTLATCRRIKSRPAPPGVLLYTAYARQALAAPADEVVDKADSPHVLLEAIRRIASS